VWSDDFHHAVHAFFTGERKGYYQDFGSPEQIAKALEKGFVFQGEWFEFWKARRGTRPEGVPLEAHVICTQNHDQVGNRAIGERLTALVPRGVRKLAAALLLLSAETPLLFMGQEYDERQPFQFFSSYGDPALQKAVREGRRKEFKDFAWDEVPDPQDAATFERSKLTLPPDVRQLPEDQREMLEWYRALLALRRELIADGERSCRAELQGDALVMQVPRERPRVIVIAGLRAGAALPNPPSGWTERLASDEDGYRVRVLTGSVSTLSK
jgi:maltooligosyltrehalose trehalohydrolase